MSVKTVDIIKKETVEIEEFWVIRGIKDTGLNKTVVAEFEMPVAPNSLAIAQFLVNYPSVDFCSIEHNFRLKK